MDIRNVSYLLVEPAVSGCYMALGLPLRVAAHGCPAPSCEWTPSSCPEKLHQEFVDRCFTRLAGSFKGTCLACCREIVVVSGSDKVVPCEALQDRKP